MLKIAITGGIGAGKTAITDYLKYLDFTVIDGDVISREMTGPGGCAITAICEKAERSEERRVGKECRSRWSPYH